MVSMYMEEADIEYFKSMSKDTGIPYKTLISMYLTDCRKSASGNDYGYDSRKTLPFSLPAGAAAACTPAHAPPRLVTRLRAPSPTQITGPPPREVNPGS